MTIDQLLRQMTLPNLKEALRRLKSRALKNRRASRAVAGVALILMIVVLVRQGTPTDPYNQGLTYVRMLTPSPWKTKVESWLLVVDIDLRGTEVEKRQRAVTGFQKLGTNGLPFLPVLTTLLTNRNCSSEAALCLLATGDKGWNTLFSLAKDSSASPIAQNAAWFALLHSGNDEKLGRMSLADLEARKPWRANLVHLGLQYASQKKATYRQFLDLALNDPNPGIRYSALQDIESRLHNLSWSRNYQISLPAKNGPSGARIAPRKLVDPLLGDEIDALDKEIETTIRTLEQKDSDRSVSGMAWKVLQLLESLR